jgi:excisionase family DNA binding protein
MALSSAKFESVNGSGRREAEAVARQLEGSTRRRSATVKLQGLMLKLVRELTDIVLHYPGVVIAPFERELSPDAAGKILGISRPLVVRRMDDGRLPFRFEGKHRRCKLEDVLRFKAAEENQAATLSAHTNKDRVDVPSRSRPDVSVQEIDELVLGTTNAPYRRSISASELTHALMSGRSGRWAVHVATFFTDVRPKLVLRFAELHGIPTRKLAFAYSEIKDATGEANPALENLLEQLAPTT